MSIYQKILNDLDIPDEEVSELMAQLGAALLTQMPANMLKATEVSLAHALDNDRASALLAMLFWSTAGIVSITKTEYRMEVETLCHRIIEKVFGSAAGQTMASKVVH